MKIGRGKLLWGKGSAKKVSIRVTLNGKSRRATFSAGTPPTGLAWIFSAKMDWLVTDPAQWAMDSYRKDGKTVHLATPEEMAAIWAEIKRTMNDPAEVKKAARAQESAKKSGMRQKLKRSMLKVKKCVKELILQGADVGGVEAELAALLKEALIEVVQES